MGKTISTFFLISFITSFSQKHFICALKKFVHNSVVPTDGANTKVEFLNLEPPRTHFGPTFVANGAAQALKHVPMATKCTKQTSGNCLSIFRNHGRR